MKQVLIHFRRISRKLVILVGLFLLIGCLSLVSLNYYWQTQFDEGDWASSPSLRYRMINDWIKTFSPECQTEEDVILSLGPPDLSFKPMYSFAELIYYLGPNGREAKVLLVDWGDASKPSFIVDRVGLDDW
ncbi:MAG: hypothetical protein ACI9TH_001539 [Kiritimatiellia bacterium]|jgi:hypothetical protein